MEQIKDRLSHIIRAKNLTPKQFAELMQVQPSNVSHLLNGRNKPSLDFLIKLKEVFPEYSYEWIILGKKPITNSDRTTAIKDDLFKPIEMFGTIEEDSRSKEGDFVMDDNIEQFESKIATASSIPSKSGDGIASKNVKQIIYVYDDHTFEIYDLRK